MESNTLKKQETELLTQKKSLSSEDYKKKVSALRKKNVDFQILKEKNQEIQISKI